MKINDDIRAVLGFSPRHTYQLLAALEGIDHRDVDMAAEVLGTKCRELRIADFPNPYRGKDEQATANWDRIFLPAYRDETVIAPVEPEEEDETGEPDFEVMTKAEIQELVEERFNQRVSMHTDKPTMVQKALKIIRGV